MNPQLRRALYVTGAILIGLASAAHTAPSKRILLLSTDSHTAPGLIAFETAVRHELATESHIAVELQVEHLDMAWGAPPDAERAQIELLRAKYADREPDVVLTAGKAALDFALKEKKTMFGDAPVVFVHVTKSDLAGMPHRADVAGVVSDWKFDEQVDTALRLLPQTRHVIVLFGSGPMERGYEASWRRDFARFASKLDVQFWVGIPLRELEIRLRHLPEDSVVVYLAMYRDSLGNSFLPSLVLEQLARHSSAPIFGSFSHFIGLGAVGDGRFDISAAGTQVAQQCLRILHGATPESVGVVPAALGPLTFDARQLDRWNIPVERLPEDSVVKFREPTLWEQHRQAVLIGLAIIAAQALWLAALASQRVARRRAERLQSESANIYTSVADSLEERVATLDASGTILTANRAWHEFTRTTGDCSVEVGANYLQCVRHAASNGRPDAKRSLDALEDVLLRGETTRRLEYFGREAGEPSRYEMRIAALQRRDGGAVVTIQDVTDRWQAHERIRMTLESLAVATILVNEGGMIELVNTETEYLFGYSRADLLGRPMVMLVPRFDELARHPSANEAQRPRMTARPMDPVVMGRRKNGTDVPLQFHLQAIRTSMHPMMLASMLDLTERRRLDAEVQRHREETAHFGRLAVAGELSAAIAHELNQPLTGIMTNCQAAQRLVQNRDLSRDEMSDLFGDIVADARRAGEVIGHLRMMLRKAPREIVPLNVNDTVKEVHRLVSHDLALKQTALEFELAEDLPHVAGDRIHLQQVFLNLVLNAADAMTGMPPEARRIILRSRPGINQTIEIEVRDSGPGIPPEAMPRVFQPFFTTKKDGMGMGLSIVRSIVEFDGGRVTCANSAAGGAVFNVTLPTLKD